MIKRGGGNSISKIILTRAQRGAGGGKLFEPKYAPFEILQIFATHPTGEIVDRLK